MVQGECEDCKLWDNCSDYYGDILCSAKWLLTEHVDTWDSLAKEAKLPGANAFDIFIRCTMLHNREIEEE